MSTLNYLKYFDHTKYGELKNSVCYYQANEDSKNGGYLGLLFSENLQLSKNAMIKSITVPKDSVGALASAGDLHFHLMVGDHMIIEDIFTEVPLTATAGTADIKVDLTLKDAPAKGLRYNISYRSIEDVLIDCTYYGTNGAPVNAKFQPIANASYYRNLGSDDFTPWSVNIIVEFTPTAPTDDISGKSIVLDVNWVNEITSEHSGFTRTMV